MSFVMNVKIKMFQKEIDQCDDMRSSFKEVSGILDSVKRREQYVDSVFRGVPLDAASIQELDKEEDLKDRDVTHLYAVLQGMQNSLQKCCCLTSGNKLILDQVKNTCHERAAAKSKRLQVIGILHRKLFREVRGLQEKHSLLQLEIERVSARFKEMREKVAASGLDEQQNPMAQPVSQSTVPFEVGATSQFVELDPEAVVLEERVQVIEEAQIENKQMEAEIPSLQGALTLNNQPEVLFEEFKEKGPLTREEPAFNNMPEAALSELSEEVSRQVSKENDAVILPENILPSRNSEDPLIEHEIGRGDSIQKNQDMPVEGRVKLAAILRRKTSHKFCRAVMNSISVVSVVTLGAVIIATIAEGYGST